MSDIIRRLLRTVVSTGAAINQVWRADTTNIKADNTNVTADGAQ